MRSALVIFATAAVLAFESQSCVLPSSSNELSWMVSIHLNETEEILCIGHIISKSFVFSVVTCFNERPYVFLRGKDVYATAGWEEDVCVQVRNGKKVMGHPKYSEDQHRYNMAILEVEDFDLDQKNPPVIPLADSEEKNLARIVHALKNNSKCVVVTLSEAMSIKQFNAELPFSSAQLPREVDNTSTTNLYGLRKNVISLMPRETCWRKHYCISFNWGCLPYFQASKSYVCATLDLGGTCRDDWAGAPVLCNKKVVGFVKECMKHKVLPLMIFGTNDNHLEAIELYRNITKTGSLPSRNYEDVIRLRGLEQILPRPTPRS